MRKGLGNNKSVTFNIIVPTKTCDQCGKEFCLPVGANFEDYVYKRVKRKTSSKLYFCSWRCLQASRVESIKVVADDQKQRQLPKQYVWSERRRAKQQEKRYRQLDIILPLHECGLSMRQIANDTGLNYNTVRCRLKEMEALRNG